MSPPKRTPEALDLQGFCSTTLSPHPSSPLPSSSLELLYRLQTLWGCVLHGKPSQQTSLCLEGGISREGGSRKWGWEGHCSWEAAACFQGKVGQAGNGVSVSHSKGEQREPGGCVRQGGGTSIPQEAHWLLPSVGSACDGKTGARVLPPASCERGRPGRKMGALASGTGRHGEGCSASHGKLGSLGALQG